MNPKTICIYHGNCLDGFSSAWVVREHFRRKQRDLVGEDINIEFYPGVYQMPPPDVTDKNVILVDFSYKRPAILEMVEKAANFIIIDHHQSAILDLQNIEHPSFNSYFDINHSGVMLTWKYFFGAEEPPPLLKHIEDRDLWKFKLPNTREINAALFSFEYDFDLYDGLMALDKDAMYNMAQEGAAIERKHFKDIKEMIRIGKRRAMIGGYDVPILNVSYLMSSDAGHEMSKGEPFAACYMDTQAGRIFSLRSQEDGLNVFEVAKVYGGGGHKNAAGFKLAHHETHLVSIFSDDHNKEE